MDSGSESREDRLAARVRELEAQLKHGPVNKIEIRRLLESAQLWLSMLPVAAGLLIVISFVAAFFPGTLLTPYGKGMCGVGCASGLFLVVTALFVGRLLDTAVMHLPEKSTDLPPTD